MDCYDESTSALSSLECYCNNLSILSGQFLRASISTSGDPFAEVPSTPFFTILR
jgi:hypothetical protein